MDQNIVKLKKMLADKFTKPVYRVNKVIIAGEVNLVSNWSRVRIAQLSRGSEVALPGC